MTMRRGRQLWPVLRDIGAWVIGCALIFKQAGILFDPPSQVNETLVWVGALWVGGPGILAVITAKFGAGSPSSSPSSESPSSSAGAPTSGADA